MIRKYQEGGMAADPQEQIVQLVQAAMGGDQQASAQIQQIMEAAQQGDQQAAQLAEMIMQVMNQMQGGAPEQGGGAPVAARNGAKLNYIKKLKGECPEGQQLVYFKEGGRVCKKCIEAAAGGAKVKDGKKEIADFKKKKACGGSKMKFELGGETPQKPKKKESKQPTKRLDPRTTTTLPGGKYPEYWTSQERQLWERLHGSNDEGAAAVENKGVGKNKCGSKLKKHQQGGTIEFFQAGGKKRFQVASTKGGNVKYFDTDEEARAYQRTLPQGSSVRRDLGKEWKGSVLKVDRTKDASTAYARQQAEAPYNKLAFKDAYALARKNGVRWFGYKGKVYKSDLEGKAAKNNLTDMEAIYGNNLGWSGHPKMGTKASQQARAGYRKEIDAKQGNRNAVYKGKTNRQVSEEADRKQTWNSADFIDAISPQTAIGNFINMGTSALMGEKYTPQIYKAGYNIPGLAKDMVEGNYGDAAFRGVDAYMMFGMPGAGKAIDWAGTRFAPRLGTMGPKSAYLSRKATVAVPEGGRQINPMAMRAISGNGTSRVNGFGMRSMQRAANEGMLDRFAINGGMNNATRFGNAAVQNANTGTTYIYRNVDKAGNLIGNSYDRAVDAAVKGVSPFGLASEPVVQQAYHVADK